jgi:hypothetical protein
MKPFWFYSKWVAQIVGKEAEYEEDRLMNIMKKIPLIFF